jgi:hypothetical protein
MGTSLPEYGANRVNTGQNFCVFLVLEPSSKIEIESPQFLVIFFF